MFEFFWQAFLDAEDIYENLEYEDHVVDDDYTGQSGGPWCATWRDVYGETTDQPEGRPSRQRYLLRVIEQELAERRSHVETREAEKRQLREFRSARSLPPTEEDVDTAIARINDSNMVKDWSKAWLQEQPWTLQDYEIVEILTRAAQSAYKRGRVSLGDVLRH